MTVHKSRFHVALLAIGALLLAAVGAPAHAQTGVATITWSAVTTRTDGTLLAAGELTGYRIDWSQCAGTAPAYTMGTITGTATVAPTVLVYTNTTLSTTWTVPHCFTVTTLATAPGTDPVTGLPVTIAQTSDPSTVGSKLTLAPVVVAKPKSPAGVVVK